MADDPRSIPKILSASATRTDGFSSDERLDALKRQEDANYGGTPPYDPLLKILAGMSSLGSMNVFGPLQKFLPRQVRMPPTHPYLNNGNSVQKLPPQFDTGQLIEQLKMILSKKRPE